MLSATYLQRSRFIVVEEIQPNTWSIRVFDPKGSRGPVQVDRYRARNMIDVRRVVRIYMSKHRVIKELIYHSDDEISSFFRSKKKQLPEGIKSEIVSGSYKDIKEDIDEDTDIDTGEDNADTVDERASSVHGAGETILVRPIVESE